MKTQRDEIKTQPHFCQYSSGPCDQDFSTMTMKGGFFIYPSEPGLISTSIGLAAEDLRRISPSHPWTTWRDLSIAGQIVFCEICKTARFSDFVIGDVTTLNFNVMFEMGYCIGLRLPIIPIRDVTFLRDKQIFDQLGLLDTFGYLDFDNASVLSKNLRSVDRSNRIKFPSKEINRKQPLYLIRSPIDTDGSIKLISCLKKSALTFRNFDPRETSRLSLYDAFRQVSSSLGVITHLINPERKGAEIHNARSAFISGLAMASGIRVLMLQEGVWTQPIDYRDIVKSYVHPSSIRDILDPFFKGIIKDLQDLSPIIDHKPINRLDQLNLGDLAAENEIKGLNNYFVPTGQYNTARHGHARLIIGRKGSGKTAIFYRVRDHFSNRNTQIVLDLKPEGHQFTKLRESVLGKLTPGVQEHTLTAFWNYLIINEIALKIIKDEDIIANRDPSLKQKYNKVVEAYGEDIGLEHGDFSERLLQLVDSITKKSEKHLDIATKPEITNLIYQKDIKPIKKTIEAYLSDKENVWVLIDNIDKGWPVRGASASDIMILRCLLEATRIIQRSWEKKHIEFKTIVFIRNDIYEYLLSETPDRGKDTTISLNWTDAELFREIIRLRLINSWDIDRPFDELWSLFADSHINAEDSFGYMLERTLMRPREIIRFVQKAVEVAINRNHNKILEEDIKHAEIGYSEDSFQELVFEFGDIKSEYSNILYNFLDCKIKLEYNEIESLLKEDITELDEINSIIEYLVWLGFFGVTTLAGKTRYSYQVNYNIHKLYIDKKSKFVIHPAFRAALECTP